MKNKNLNKIIQLKETNSTNLYAQELLKTRAVDDFTVIKADYQLQGRGHGSNQWESNPGENLTFSIITFPDSLEASRQFYLSKAVSLGICDCLDQFGLQANIKWPNDIYTDKKKLAGMLIENTLKGNTIEHTIVGLGFNLNQTQFSNELPNPVSVAQLTGNTEDSELWLNCLLSNIYNRLQQLKAGTFEQLDQDYEEKLFQVQEWAKYKSHEEDFEGKITGVDEYGQLCVETRQKGTLHFDFKEIAYCL